MVKKYKPFTKEEMAAVRAGQAAAHAEAWKAIKPETILDTETVKGLLAAIKRQYCDFPDIFIKQAQSMTKAEFKEVARFVTRAKMDRDALIKELRRR